MRDREDISMYLKRIGDALYWILWNLTIIVLVLTWK